LVFLILLIVPYKSSKGPSRNAWYKIGRAGVEGILFHWSLNCHLCKAIKLTNSFLVLCRDLISWFVIEIEGRGRGNRRHFNGGE
jgi:hypothetical protein